MEALVLVGFVLLVSACFGAIALAVLINFDQVPRPQPDQIAAWLDWRALAAKLVVPPTATREPKHSSMEGSITLDYAHGPQGDASAKPDLVVTDVWLPGVDALDVVHQIRTGRPSLAVVIVDTFQIVGQETEPIARNASPQVLVLTEV